jgi:ATP-dependent RNA/DNA helicase IGHMBP2
MSNIQEELKISLQLLKQEWQEDLSQYQKKFLYTSTADKKAQGICWYPVQIKKEKLGYADRVIVELERFDTKQAHAFNSGKSVSIFSNQEHFNGKDFRINGVINQVSKDVMTVTLQVDELPDWMHEGKIGVDLLFDEASYREMEKALKAVASAEKGRLGELKSILLGEKESVKNPLAHLSIPHLNTSQEKAVNLVLQTQDVAIIHGPPGTGKTTTLISAIQYSLPTHQQVLVCAPSNAAVDLLVEKLTDLGIETIRMGHPARIEEKILSTTLDAKIAQHDSYKDLKKTRKEAAEYRKLSQKYKRNFGPEERAQRKRLIDEARKMEDDASNLEDYITYDIFQRAQVIACTLVGASSGYLKNHKFPLVFIDEAGQGLEAATWIPISKAQKVVMAGDHQQLPPTIKSFEAATKGLSETLFEKVIKRQPTASEMLKVQYRMAAPIMGFSNEKFYNGELLAAENTLSHFLPEESILEFIDTAGSGFEEHQEKESLSTLNKEEAKFTLQYLENLIKKIGISEFKTSAWNIGLISPYRAQVRKFQELIFEDYQYPNLRAFSDLLTIDSIDGFQGQERDLIVISLVRSNNSGEIGFLSDKRRMNVALTRAKEN